MATNKNEARVVTEIPSRLIVIGGGKGGVGKSTISRALVDYYDKREVEVSAFDGDLENPTLSRFLDEDSSSPRTKPLAAQTPEGFEAVVREMEKGTAKVVLADLGAGTQRHAAEFERLLGLGTAARDLGYAAVLVWLLAPCKDSIALLGQAAESHRDWHLVIARALYEVGDWSLWDTSKTKGKVDALKPEVFDVPVLDAKAFTALDKRDMRFLRASRERLGYVEAAYASRWFGSVCTLFDGCAALSAGKA